MDPALTWIAAVIVIVLVGVGLLAWRAATRQGEASAAVTRLAESAEKLTVTQSVLADRLQQTQAVVNERLDAITKRLGDGLTEHSERTGERLKALHERLAVIDAAQKNITDLSQQMVGLQDILSNKQSRGAFGQMRLEDLVRDALPAAAYAFEVTLSNARRVDCLIRLPNPPGSIAIDSKFPLEAYRALQQARDDAERVQAGRAFAADVITHIRDIAEKYIVPGETAEWAVMFVPSEAIYAEAHARFESVIAEAYRRHVAIVSPSTLMATLHTVRAILKDAQMKQQANLIQAEVAKMLNDVRLLDDRVDKLAKHFDQTARDIEGIATSSKAITRRGDRILDVQLGGEEEKAALPAAQAT
ncbi:MAG: DNA recombination protein RmuC [Rhodospirillales bacterium]|nr:DNA recombination protein RmuC [Rhodospirillales bacterium]